MGLKKNSKVSAEFSMSSLTDIIFLLLIFFMLTSSVVNINVDLPESNSVTVAPTSMTVMITKSGDFTFNGKTVHASTISRRAKENLAGLTPEEKRRATLTIAAEKGVRWEVIQDMIEVAKDLRMKAILAVQPRK